mgnify:CR=1 FL=1
MGRSEALLPTPKYRKWPGRIWSVRPGRWRGAEEINVPILSSVRLKWQKRQQARIPTIRAPDLVPEVTSLKLAGSLIKYLPCSLCYAVRVNSPLRRFWLNHPLRERIESPPHEGGHVKELFWFGDYQKKPVLDRLEVWILQRVNAATNSLNDRDRCIIANPGIKPKIEKNIIVPHNCHSLPQPFGHQLEAIHRGPSSPTNHRGAQGLFEDTGKEANENRKSRDWDKTRLQSVPPFCKSDEN